MFLFGYLHLNLVFKRIEFALQVLITGIVPFLVFIKSGFDLVYSVLQMFIGLHFLIVGLEQLGF